MLNDREDYQPGAFKVYISGVLRTFFSMLFFGGICGVIAYALRFVMGMFLEYSFYKDEIVGYTSLIIAIIAYPLFEGFRHVENCGYLDSYDGTFSLRSYFKRIGVSSVLMLVIPAMIALRVNFLIVYVYDLCYYPSNGVSEFISETFLHKFEGTTPVGIAMGTFITFFVYLMVLIPFYYAGRRHHRRDVNNGVKISVV